MSTTIQTARSLSQKLQTFRGTLTQDEQAALDKLLVYFNNKVKASSGGAELLKLSGGRGIIDEMNRALPKGQLDIAITPTITTITITTILASHPVITCTKIDASIKGTIVTRR